MVKCVCIICQREFDAIKSTKKYCSKECENEARRNRNKIPKNYQRTCLICEKVFTLRNNHAIQRSCCYECMPEGIQLSRSNFLDLLRQNRGGQCEKCGYNFYLGNLEFHHIDPSKKDFTIGDRDFRLKDCIEESKKCILLCGNCHRELHAGLWKLEEGGSKLDEAD